MPYGETVCCGGCHSCDTYDMRSVGFQLTAVAEELCLSAGDDSLGHPVGGVGLRSTTEGEAVSKKSEFGLKRVSCTVTIDFAYRSRKETVRLRLAPRDGSSVPSVCICWSHDRRADSSELPVFGLRTQSGENSARN